MTALLRASVGLHAGAFALSVAAPAAWPWSVGAVALNHALLAGVGLWPGSALLGPNLRRLPATGRPEIALTFDDGPDPVVTPAVLDLLAAHGARATFFCIGARARRHPDLVRAIAAGGHAVENHTDRHLNRFACLAPAALRREVAAAQDTLAALAGTPPRFFRAPMGFRSPLLQPVLAGRGLRLVSWTRRALDGVRTDAGAARRRLLHGLRAGDILLLHDGSCARPVGGAPVVLEVLPGLLRAAANAGLRSRTLAEGTAPQEPQHQPRVHPRQQQVVAPVAEV